MASDASLAACGPTPRTSGGPGVTRSDLLVINQTDLARYVGADLEVMRHDAMLMRGERPTLFTSLVDDPDALDVAAFLLSAL